MKNNFLKENKCLVRFLCISSVIVLLETILISALGYLTPWHSVIVAVGFFTMVFFSFYSASGFIQGKRKDSLPILIGSTILLLSFALTFYYSFLFNHDFRKI